MHLGAFHSYLQYVHSLCTHKEIILFLYLLLIQSGYGIWQEGKWNKRSVGGKKDNADPSIGMSKKNKSRVRKVRLHSKWLLNRENTLISAFTMISNKTKQKETSFIGKDKQGCQGLWGETGQVRRGQQTVWLGQFHRKCFCAQPVRGVSVFCTLVPASLGVSQSSEACGEDRDLTKAWLSQVSG